MVPKSLPRSRPGPMKPAEERARPHNLHCVGWVERVRSSWAEPRRPAYSNVVARFVGSTLNRSQKRRRAMGLTSAEATPEVAPAQLRDQLPRTENPACRQRNLDPSVHPSAFGHKRGAPHSESSTWFEPLAAAGCALSICPASQLHWNAVRGALRVIRIIVGIAMTVGGGILLIKAGGPTRASKIPYTGRPPDMRFQFAGLVLLFVGPALIIGRKRPRQRPRITDYLDN
jgi:hypothetical protein